MLVVETVIIVFVVATFVVLGKSDINLSIIKYTRQFDALPKTDHSNSVMGIFTRHVHDTAEIFVLSTADCKNNLVVCVCVDRCS